MTTNNAANNPTGASATVLQGQGVGTASAFSTTTYPVTAASGDVIYASGTNVIGNLPAPTSAIPGQFLSNTGTLPQWFDPRNTLQIWDDFLTDVNSSGNGN